MNLLVLISIGYQILLLHSCCLHDKVIDLEYFMPSFLKTWNYEFLISQSDCLYFCVLLIIMYKFQSLPNSNYNNLDHSSHSKVEDGYISTRSPKKISQENKINLSISSYQTLLYNFNSPSSQIISLRTVQSFLELKY